MSKWFDLAQSHLLFYSKSWSSEGCEDMWQANPQKGFDCFFLGTSIVETSVLIECECCSFPWHYIFSPFTWKRPESLSKWEIYWPLLRPSTLSYPPWIKLGTSVMLWPFLTHPYAPVPPMTVATTEEFVSNTCHHSHSPPTSLLYYKVLAAKENEAVETTLQDTLGKSIPGYILFKCGLNILSFTKKFFWLSSVIKG